MAFLNDVVAPCKVRVVSLHFFVKSELVNLVIHLLLCLLMVVHIVRIIRVLEIYSLLNRGYHALIHCCKLSNSVVLLVEEGRPTSPTIFRLIC